METKKEKLFRIFNHESQQFIAMNNEVEPAIMFSVNSSTNFSVFDAELLLKVYKLAREKFPSRELEIIEA